MQHQKRLQGSIVAPSPVVPTRRPSSHSSHSSQWSRRIHSSMSAASTGDVSDPGTPDSRVKNETVPELVQLFQAQNASRPATPQNPGAREILKAGQRRLRQLAQRQRRPTDPKSKAEEASRQLLALQQEGFLPPPRPRRTDPKRSIDSTISHSYSTSDLSFMSNSRQDVESIGQPWLVDPLGKLNTHDRKDSHVTSIDIRDLTSLVESSGPLSPTHEGSPPPYQPSPQSNVISGDNNELKQHRTNASDLHCNPSQAGDRQDNETEAHKSPNPLCRRNEDDSKKSSSAPPEATSSSDIHRPSTEQSQETRAKEANDNLDKSARNSAMSSTSASSQPPAHTLKLFPDTMSPRASTKGTWRISNGRPPNGPLPATPDTRRGCVSGTSKSSWESINEVQKPSADTPNAQDNVGNPSSSDIKQSMQSTKLSGSATDNPMHENFPHTGRRPTSLPLGAINSFPLPVPMLPLPSLPEPVSGIYAGRDRNTVVGQRVSQAHSSQPDRQPSGENRMVHAEENRDYSTSTTPIMESKGSMTGIQKDSAKTSMSSQVEPTQLVRTGPGRAERVHALKMKDMSASRLNPKGAGKSMQEEREQSPSSLRLTQSRSSQRTGGGSLDSRHNDASPPSPSLSPPSKLPAKSPANESMIGKRTCSSPIYSNVVSVETDERLSLPGSTQNSRIYRSSGAKSASIICEKMANEQDVHNQSQNVFPTSDDECIGTTSYKDYQPRPTSAPPRRTKPAPSAVNELASYRARHSKKKLPSESARPTTPRNRRSRGIEKSSPQSPHSQNTYYSQDSRGSRHHAYTLNLEGRIAHLERQNKILQAALFAALDVGVKQNMESLLGGLNTAQSASGTGRSSYSSTSNLSSVDELPPKRSKLKRQSHRRQGSWIASPDSSQRDSYGSDDSANLQEVEDMIEDFDLDWMSDKSTPERRLPMVRTRPT